MELSGRRPGLIVRLKLFFHDACFDGTASAALFSAFYRGREPGAVIDPIGMRHQLGDPFAAVAVDGDDNACVDFRYAADPRMRWWFDHHATAFQPPALRADYESRSGETMAFDPAAPSCAGLITRTLATRFGWPVPPHLAELTTWADTIDSAAYDSATAACALDDSGVVTCLSYADGGEDIASEVPAVEDENDEFETISVGRTHACGIRRSRVPVCWGESSQYEAMGFSASIDCTEVFAGNNATYADCDGYGWFEGGEEGVSIELGADLLAAPLSYGWVCVADDGSVQCSGSIPVAGESSTLEYELSDERLEMPPPAGDVVSISAGETAFCAVLVDDTTEKHAVVCNEFNNEWSALTDPP